MENLNELKAKIHMHVNKLMLDPSLPADAKKELIKITKDLNSANNTEELNQIGGRFHALSDSKLSLTRDQRGEIYSPSCWIGDYIYQKR